MLERRQNHSFAYRGSLEAKERHLDRHTACHSVLLLRIKTWSAPSTKRRRKE